MLRMVADNNRSEINGRCSQDCRQALHKGRHRITCKVKFLARGQWRNEQTNCSGDRTKSESPQLLMKGDADIDDNGQDVGLQTTR